MSTARLTAALLAALLLSGCRVFGDPPILVHAGKPRALLALDPTSGETLWSHPRPKHCKPHRKPVVHDGTVYVGYLLENDPHPRAWPQRAEHGPTLFAIDQRTGEQKWAAPMGRVRGKIVVAGGLVLCGYADDDHAETVGHCIGLDAETGEVVWRVDRRMALEGAIGDVCFWSEYDRLHALEVADGLVRWMTPLRGGRSRAWMPRVHIEGETLCLVDAMDGPALRVLDPETGGKLWIYEGHGVPQQLSLGEDLIGAALDGKLVSVRSSDGELQWTYPLPPRESGRHHTGCELLHAGKRIALLSAPDETAHLIDFGEGLRWSSQWKLPPRHRRAFGLAPGLILVRSSEALRGYDLDDGMPRWRLNLPPTAATFLVGKRLVAINQGALIALSLDDVSELWRRRINAMGVPTDGTKP